MEEPTSRLNVPQSQPAEISPPIDTSRLIFPRMAEPLVDTSNNTRTQIRWESLLSNKKGCFQSGKVKGRIGLPLGAAAVLPRRVHPTRPGYKDKTAGLRIRKSFSSLFFVLEVSSEGIKSIFCLHDVIRGSIH